MLHPLPHPARLATHTAWLTALMLTSAAALAADAEPESDPAKVPEMRAGSGILLGYLARKDLPNSLALLPPPPAPGSSALAADEEAHQKAKAQRSPARWALAANDAVLKFPAAAATFYCTLGVPISQQATPHLTMLLRRSLTDAGLATYAAKDHYQRQPPFARFAAPGRSRPGQGRFLPVRPRLARLGLGPGADRGSARAGARPAGARLCLWPKPRHLRRALAKRCGCRPAGGWRHRGAAAKQR